MLTAPLKLPSDPTILFDFLYQIFHRDFVASITYLNTSIAIDPQSDYKENDKETSFWHLTSRNQKVMMKQGQRYVPVVDRLPDYRRSERLEWVRQIISNHADPSIKMFYHRKRDGKKPLRLYLWADQDDFVVILQKLGKSSSFLVTSFYIDYPKKRTEFENLYKVYRAKQEPSLHKCEWF